MSMHYLLLITYMYELKLITHKLKKIEVFNRVNSNSCIIVIETGN
ncbi:hypothetical protein BXY64_1944 [Marinifilum flexuosum]|uniref:Uncharacterized protein n=1 Tax=Marinifilum flexuosum TaxID=1117708 RepID=A0A419XAX0_9BACT|nr:hypothetical protein BXY64_1944 [Marinifilum flexuosum]